MRDFERPLTPAGHAEARAVGQAMLAAGYLPTRVICSPARRAVETWQGVAEAMRRKPGEALLSETLYAADAGGYLNILRNSGESDSLLLVGHNPMIEDLAIALSAEADEDARSTLAKGFPTAGLAVFSMASAEPAGARLDAFLIPAEL